MSGTSLQRVIYWDACIYLAWLKDEQQHGKPVMDAIHETAHENFQKKVLIVTSTITFVEVLAAKLTPEQERKFRKSFRTQDHLTRDVDPPVAMKAHDFRQAFLSHPTGKMLSTPDAIHLATGSFYAQEFWTLDDGKSDKKYIGLLELNGDARVGGLKICKPQLAQPSLFSMPVVASVTQSQLGLPVPEQEYVLPIYAVLPPT